MLVVHKNVLIKLSNPEEKGGSGLIMPDAPGKEDIQEGTVEVFGEDVPQMLKTLLTNNPKSRVRFSKFYEGERVDIEGVPHIVINYKNILIIY